MKYSGLRDKHLNVFVNYAAPSTHQNVEGLENNITKALINTLESLDLDDEKKSDEKRIFQELFNIDLPESFSCEFYLQWQGGNKEIKAKIESAPVENRFLLAFNPVEAEKKYWGADGSDTKDESTIRAELTKEYKSTYPEWSDEETDRKVKHDIEDIRKNRNGKSIPDGLIIIKSKEQECFLYAIALENKKWYLNPYQLNNHLEKSLMLNEQDEKKGHILYRTYKDIIKAVAPCETYMTDSFVEYMVILGYGKPDNFEECFLHADNSIKKRLCFPFGEEILKKVKDLLAEEENSKKSKLDTIDERDHNTWRLHVRYDNLKEINLVFNDAEYVKLSLAFASTQRNAKILYSNPKVDPENFQNVPEEWHARASFHLTYCGRGRNVGASYIDDKDRVSMTLYEYVKFWKENIDCIRQTENKNPVDSVRLYEKMADSGLIKADKCKKMKEYFQTKSNDVLVVPEIIVEPRWTYEEIGNMGMNGFAKTIKEKLDEIIPLFNPA